MKADLITRAALTASSTVPLRISKGHLNGILVFSTGALGASTFNIRRRTKLDTKLLANNVQATDLIRISEAENAYGHGASAWAQALENLLVSKGTITNAEVQTLETTTGQRGLSFSYIDLGSLYLNSDNELDVSITGAVGLAAQNIGVYAVSHTKRPDYMRQYDIVLDFDTTHHQVDSVWFRCTARNIIDIDQATSVVTESTVNFTIRDDDDVVQLDAVGALAVSSMFNNNSALADQTLIRIYRKRDPIPADVSVKVAGAVPSVVTPIYLVVVRVIFDLASTSANTITEADEFTRRISALESKDPATAMALRHSGLIPSAEALSATVNAVR